MGNGLGMIPKDKVGKKTTERAEKDNAKENPQLERDPKIFAEEEDLDEEKASFIEKFLARRPVRITMFVIMVLYGIFHVIVLWCWVADALSVRKALVFGPPSQAITNTLIGVAVVGSASFICEVVSSVMKNVYDRKLVSEEVAEVVTMCVEEVPTVTLSVLLASCWEVPLSLYQLAKSLGAIFGAVFRSVRVLTRYLKSRRSLRRGHHRPMLAWIIRVIILTACVFCLIGSVLVWVFTFHDSSGTFRAPRSIKRKAYDHGRYLYKSAVYFTHPLIARCDDTPSTLPGVNLDDRLWIKMASIYDIQDSKVNFFEFYYNDARAVSHAMVEFKNGRHESWYGLKTPDCTAVELYESFESFSNVTESRSATGDRELHFFKRFLHENGTVNELPELTSDFSTAEFSKVMRFSFGLKKRSKTLVFGDITFKAALIDNATLQYLTTDEWGNLQIPCQQGTQARFQYFRVHQNVTDESTFHREGDGMLKPYVHGVHTVNVTKAWKTGYKQCDMTGSLRPNPADALKVPCLMD